MGPIDANTSCFVNTHLDRSHFDFSHSACFFNTTVPRHLPWVKLSHFSFCSYQIHRGNDPRHGPGSGLCLQSFIAGSGEEDRAGIITHLAASQFSNVLNGMIQLNDGHLLVVGWETHRINRENWMMLVPPAVVPRTAW